MQNSEADGEEEKGKHTPGKTTTHLSPKLPVDLNIEMATAPCLSCKPVTVVRLETQPVSELLVSDDTGAKQSHCALGFASLCPQRL